MTDDDLVTTLVPDLDRDLLAVLQQLEELLLMLSATGDPEQDIPDLPAPVADDTVLGAVRAIWDALKPTQHPADGPHAGQLLGPDSRYEHVPLVPVTIRRADLTVLAAAAKFLGASHPASDIGEVLTDAATIGPHTDTVSAGRSCRPAARRPRPAAHHRRCRVATTAARRHPHRRRAHRCRGGRLPTHRRPDQHHVDRLRR